MSEWRTDAHEGLAGACSAFAANSLRQAVVLLDAAAALIAQGYLTERGLQPKTRRDGRTAPVPDYLRAMKDLGNPALPAHRCRSLLRLHELRSLLVHQVDARVSIGSDEVLGYLRHVFVFSRDYGVEAPLLIPGALGPADPVEILVDYASDPARLPDELRRLAVEYCRRRGILAGVVANVGWPLVRCCLCKSLVTIDEAGITQEDCMTEDEENVAPYCNWGCACAHQNYMREVYGDAATGDWSTEYYIQPLIEQIPGVLEGRWGPGLVRQ